MNSGSQHQKKKKKKDEEEHTITTVTQFIFLVYRYTVSDSQYHFVPPSLYQCKVTHAVMSFV